MPEIISFGSEHVETVCRAGRKLIRSFEKCKHEAYESEIEYLVKAMDSIRNMNDPHALLLAVNGQGLYRFKTIYLTNLRIEESEYYMAVLEELVKHTKELSNVFYSESSGFAEHFIDFLQIAEALANFDKIDNMELMGLPVENLRLFARLSIRSLELPVTDKEWIIKLLQMNLPIDKLKVCCYGYEETDLEDCLKALSQNTNLKVCSLLDRFINLFAQKRCLSLGEDFICLVIFSMYSPQQSSIRLVNSF